MSELELQVPSSTLSAGEAEPEGILSNLSNLRSLQMSSEFLTSAAPPVRDRVHAHRPSDASPYEAESFNDEFIDVQDYDYDAKKGGQNSNEYLIVPGIGQSASRSLTRRKKQERVDLEIWWVNSPTWRRAIPVICIIMLILSITHACLGVYFFTGEDKDAKDFDVCKTESCKDIADWINQGLNRSVDPCHNFFDFVCSKFRNPLQAKHIIPSAITFGSPKFQFNQDGVLAGALKPHEGDPNRIIISFFKSCLDERNKFKTENETIAKIINETIPDLFTNASMFDIVEAAKKVGAALFHVGFFAFNFLNFPKMANSGSSQVMVSNNEKENNSPFRIFPFRNLTVEEIMTAKTSPSRILQIYPPQPWILDYRLKLSNQQGYNMVRNDLLKTYKTLWVILEQKIGKPLIDATRAVNLTVRALKLLTIPPVGNNTNSELTKNLTLLGKLFGDEWEPTIVEVNKFRFSPRIFRNILDEIPLADLHHTLQSIADEATAVTQDMLNLRVVFPEAISASAESPERFCLESLTFYLKSYTILQFLLSLDVRVLTEKMEAAFLEMRRAMRYVYFTHNLADNLKLYDALILRAFMNPRNKIHLSYPFPHNKVSKEYFTTTQKFYSTFRPGSNYLQNTREAIKMNFKGSLDAWRHSHIDFEKAGAQRFELEFFETALDNQVQYENTVHPPIVLFDRPLFLNDMRVFDHAGTILFLARNLLTLWKANLGDTGAVKSIFQVQEFARIEKFVKNLTNDAGSSCQIQKKTVHRQVFLKESLSKDALSFIIVLQLLRNHTQFVSRAFKVNRTIAEKVEPLFYSNGTFDFVEVYKENGFPKYKILDKSDYIPFQAEKIRRFQFKRAPNGLEDFTEDQLFFVAAIRHHCYDMTRDDDDSTKRNYTLSINGALEQVKEFAAVWSCPLGSPMNPPNKCI